MTPAGATSQTGRGVLLNAVTEKQWMGQVEAWAKRAGWRIYHTWDSRHSPSGFPDLVLCKPSSGEIVYAELKTERGRISQAQWAWIEALKACNQRVCVWRPSDEINVKAILGLADA